MGLVRSRTEAVFGADQWEAMYSLIMSESGFQPLAQNPESGACGLFQSLPCSKMGCQLKDVDCQLTWGMAYISERYGSPHNAWNFHLSHNWY